MFFRAGPIHYAYLDDSRLCTDPEKVSGGAVEKDRKRDGLSNGSMGTRPHGQ